MTLGGADGGINGTGLEIFAEDGAISIGFFGHRIITTKSALSVDTWYHIVIRHTDTAGAETANIEVYIDGTLVATTAEAGSNQTLNTVTPTTAYLGYRESTPSYGASKLAGFGIHHASLATAERNELRTGPEPTCTVAPSIGLA
jgi:hypothetical protein